DLGAGDWRKDAEPVRCEPQVVTIRRNSRRDDAPPFDFTRESRFEGLDHSVLAAHLQNPAIRFDAHVTRLSFLLSDAREVYESRRNSDSGNRGFRGMLPLRSCVFRLLRRLRVASQDSVEGVANVFESVFAFDHLQSRGFAAYFARALLPKLRI